MKNIVFIIGLNLNIRKLETRKYEHLTIDYGSSWTPICVLRKG